MLVAAVLVAIGACARVAEEPAPVAAPRSDLAPLYAGLAADNDVYRVDAGGSQVRVVVRRGGRLETLGHDHVIVARGLDGFVAIASDLRRSRADLVLVLSDLVIDDPGDREAAGLEGAVSDRARSATRDNMLGAAVLDMDRHPTVALAVRGVRGRLPAVTLEGEITIRGTSRPAEIPATVRPRSGRLVVDAGFPIVQTRFGIEPYSVLGGALRVRDTVEVQVHMVAVPWRPGS